MSPILDMQRSLRRLGRLRMGNQVQASNGKMRPNKLESWRMTSPSRELIDAAAVLYGGEVHEWVAAPSGRQWELYTEADALDVVIPPGEMAFSQWYEMWSGGGCNRRCDGQVEQMSGDACLCPFDAEQRKEMAAKGQACKPTSRLFVVLPHLPDVGMWHAEFHGYYAAVELPATIDIIRLASANGNLIPARLRIEQRTTKREGSTLNYAVPVIELPTLTPHTLMTGEVPAGEIGPARAALPAPAPPVENFAPATVPKAAEPAPPARQAQKADGLADVGVFGRAIKQAAKRAGLDGTDLDALCRQVAGKPLAELHDPKDANAVLDALKAAKVS